MDWLNQAPDHVSEYLDTPTPTSRDSDSQQPYRWTEFGDENDVESNLEHESIDYDLGVQALFDSDGQSQVSGDRHSASTFDFARPGSSLPTQDGSTDLGEAEEEPSRSTTPAKWTNRLEVCLPQSSLKYPRSRIDGWVPPLPPTRESTALANLMDSPDSQEQDSLSEDDFIEFELNNFSVYVKNSMYDGELRPLHYLATKFSHDTFYFDGILSNGGVKHYVQSVQFGELPIGNYGQAFSTVGDQIWIRSRLNQSKEIYYKLKHPSAEYARFFTPFLWLADLAKHVVDFCSWMIESKRQVTLKHFQRKFAEQLLKVHEKSLGFQRWHKQHGSDDYRTSIVANLEFIWKEVCGVLGPKTAASLQIFSETRLFTQYKPPQVPSKGNRIPPTIVTPYAYECFGHMKIGRLLKVLDQGVSDGEDLGGSRTKTESPDPLTQDTMLDVSPSKHQPAGDKLLRNSPTPAHNAMIASIKPGDVISTSPDGEGTGTKWKREVAKGFVDDNRWFGLVQRAHVTPKTSTRSFDVIWLYRPVDTPCCRMKYPWEKELFLSDHCTCDEGRDARWDEDEVLGKHTVDWLGDPETTTAEFFVRQTYMVEERRFVTLDPKKRMCDHDASTSPYTPGDTVLAAEGEDAKFAEPYEVVEVFGGPRSPFARLRKLLRRKMVEPQAKNTRPNELVYTEHLVVAHISNILGKCLVRFFRPGEPIPSPYNRDGTANAFFITHKLHTHDDGKETCVPFEGIYPLMRQGFDPESRAFRKLRGLDLFCGSGNFGRGLEEGGVVNMEWTNDIWDRAVHTYMANTPAKTRPFLGSVDHLLQSAIEGNYSDSVPRPGEVDFISGGSPCQGFSLLTDDKKCDRQVKNQSLVASFASFVDFYRPKYGILENVPAIVQSSKNRAEDVFSQLICFIVGMGYQAQIILGDSWSYGAPQNRSRVFLYFAAPGYRLPDAPTPSHSHHPNVMARALGIMSNGEPFVRRSFEPRAFKFVSAAEGTADLPEIADGKPDCCVGYPDHRLQGTITPTLHQQYSAIPTHPYGMNFARAWKEGAGVMTQGERELFPMHKCSRTASNSKGWGRISPVDVFSTITTSCGPQDSRTGRLLHWHQNRPITIMEARRAQGFPDHEVILGSPADQWKLVGNSVARQIALALGLQFREAWLGSLYDERSVAVPVPQVCGDPLKTAVPEEEKEEEEGSCVAQISAKGRNENEEWPTTAWTPSASETPDFTNEPLMRSASESTPATSASEAAETPANDGTKKRPLSRTLAEELQVSKRRQQEAQYEGSLFLASEPTEEEISSRNLALNPYGPEYRELMVSRAPFGQPWEEE